MGNISLAVWLYLFLTKRSMSVHCYNYCTSFYTIPNIYTLNYNIYRQYITILRKIKLEYLPKLIFVCFCIIFLYLYVNIHMECGGQRTPGYFSCNIRRGYSSPPPQHFSPSCDSVDFFFFVFILLICVSMEIHKALQKLKTG